MLAALALVLCCVCLRAWKAAPSLQKPPAPARCPRWLQVGAADSPMVCVPLGEEALLYWAGLPWPCLSWLAMEPASPGDRLVLDRGRAHGCRRGRARPGLLESLGVAVAVNRADEAELTTLPGVGPSLARRIVSERRRGGPFGQAGDLQRVRGIGPRLAARLRRHLTF
ncbi:MAG: helix-hairpin-helix domain-containing protein [Polyangia bacterium]|nr:helix-hairpin-helix domain-containing protein [Polyangia bacterium]